MLLIGEGMSELNIRQFSHWLRERRGRNGKLLKAGSFNSILNKCAVFCIWCGKWEINRPYGRNSSLINQTADLQISKAWKAKRVRVRVKKLAPDLDESEIIAIEQYLKQEVVIKRGENLDVVFRNYLIWRLAIEMGLRISEILALRLQDCPQYGKNYISIIRIDERGSDYIDPRGVYAPRPKTLSRDLGFIIEDSPLPRLIQKYISKHRYRKKQCGGKQFLLEHDFLILAKNTGSPLAIFSAESIAKKIAKNSSVSGYHWHIARHAFFNRTYSAVALNQSHVNDLVYYGGWSDPKSLKIYAQSAIRTRSIKALAIWQGNQWEALN